MEPEAKGHVCDHQILKQYMNINEHLCLTSEQKLKTDFTSLLMEYTFTKVLDIDKYYTLPE